MKKLIAFVVLMALGSFAIADVKDPVIWSFSARKKSAGVYEVVLTASISNPWHIYSTTSPKGMGMPTKINFKANPLVKLSGAVKEVGKLEKVYDKYSETTVHYYANKVEFVQTVTVKGSGKTNVSGTVDYMVCNDERCLPATKKSFAIKLQ